MDVREIPDILFRKFAVENIDSELMIGQSQCGTWLRVTDNGRVDCSGKYLKLWGTREAAVEDYGSAIFELFAGTRDTGTWAAGYGNLQEERAEIQIFKSFNLARSDAILLLLIMADAIKLVHSEGLELTRSWENKDKPDPL